MSTPADRPSEARPPERALASIAYADALEELEAILTALEGEAVDVDVLAERVRRAAVLVGVCRARLGAARIEVEAVVADLDRAADEGITARG